jgi:diguanylate cyclase (GGDEF)-like protein/PAS domain S-box-containing protein
MSEFHDFEICRGILESLPAGLCVIDSQKRVVFWSDGAERITGHLRYDVIGKSSVSEPLLYCDQPGCEFCGDECPLARALKSARPTESMGFLHHKAGHEIPVRARAVPVRNPHGSVIGAVAVFEDQHHPLVHDQHEDRTRLRAWIDEITGLPNREMLQPHLREALATYADLHVPFGVLCFRLQRLDQFRASFGPEAANSFLRVVARTLENALWRTDFVGRWSDDQFLVILNGCQEEALYTVRERVRRMLNSDAIEWWGERRSLPLAMGYATPQPGDTVEFLMERVQKSLDAASAAPTLSAAAAGHSSSSDPDRGSQ